MSVDYSDPSEYGAGFFSVPRFVYPVPSALSWESRRRDRRDEAGKAEDVLDEAFGNDLLRPAFGENAPILHGDQMGGVATGVIKVVQDGNHGAAFGVEVGEKVEHLDLVGDVEELVGSSSRRSGVSGASIMATHTRWR